MAKAKSSIYLQNLGRHIKKLRESKGHSLRTLAAESGIDYSDIGKIERGEKNITYLTMVELANALGMPLKKILDFKPDEE